MGTTTMENSKEDPYKTMENSKEDPYKTKNTITA